MEGKYCTFRGRVKTVEAEGTIIRFTFDYADTIKIQGIEYGVAWGGTKDEQLKPLKKDEKFTVNTTNKQRPLLEILLKADRREVTVTCGDKTITKVVFSYD